MPYSRPPYTQLQGMAANDISGQLAGTEPQLRYNNLGIWGTVLAKLANLHYGFQNWIAKMCTPWGAEDEYALGWGTLKGVVPLGATVAGGIVNGAQQGAVTFSNSTPGVTILADTPLVRQGDQFIFTTIADATVAEDGTVTVIPLAGNPGSIGNSALDVTMTLGVSIAGIQSNGLVSQAIIGGTDNETIAAYKNRYLQVYQNPPQGGAAADYVKWAREVPGVTRAWCLPLVMGAGTVGVYFMMDIVESVHQGFPQGNNGVATLETRDFAATGDQLTVANYIYGDATHPRQPVPALVYSLAPQPNAVAFTIAGLAAAPGTVKTAIEAAISGCLIQNGEPTGTIPVLLSSVEAAIAAVPGSAGFIIEVPDDINIVSAVGFLPVLGAVTWV